MMKGYYEAYSYVLIMPNKEKMRVVSDTEANEYFEEKEVEFDDGQRKNRED